MVLNYFIMIKNYFKLKFQVWPIRWLSMLFTFPIELKSKETESITK